MDKNATTEDPGILNVQRHHLVVSMNRSKAWRNAISVQEELNGIQANYRPVSLPTDNRIKSSLRPYSHLDINFRTSAVFIEISMLN